MFTAAAVTFGALLPIVNPLSTVPVFHALSAHMTEERRRSEARNVAIATFLLLAGFLLVGRFVLDFFGISLAALEIAGGLVVGYAGWGMITNGVQMPKEEHDPDASIFMSPITMPLQAGPGALGVTLGMDALVRTLGLIVLAIAVELVYHGVTAEDV